MRPDPDIAFAMNDAASANFMKVKAECLLQAGVLENRQALEIIMKANQMIGCSEKSGVQE